MKRVELIVVGAGPAGLCAAIEAAAKGLEVVVFDENSKPGGQLFKQIHKFFGSKEHRAKERGFRIGEKLLEEATALGVQVVLNATVMGIFENRQLSVMIDGTVVHYRANSIIMATGASENTLPFPGWTLPGVIGAGAAQTMMNLHGVMPGKRVLMVGSGNVGLVVGYQLLQAGCELAAIIDASPRVGGYGVHASKLARTGVPFYTSHTIVEAVGDGKVESALIAEVDSKWQIIPGTEKRLQVDTICLAVGLTPMSQLSKMAGCTMLDSPAKGGNVPVVDAFGRTSVQGLFAAGDLAGIEEASSAMIQGRIAGLAAAFDQGYLSEEALVIESTQYQDSLKQLREGMFGHAAKGRTDLTHTDEGHPLSQTLLKKGYVADVELSHFPGAGIPENSKKRIRPIIECTQNIPCNPCQDACAKGCIKIGSSITRIPAIDEEVDCTGCGMCVVSCSGQAIFLVDETFTEDEAAITIPYEFHPLPSPGDVGFAYNRSGGVLGEARVVSVKKNRACDETALLTMQVSKEWTMQARFFKPSAIPKEEAV